MAETRTQLEDMDQLAKGDIVEIDVAAWGWTYLDAAQILMIEDELQKRGIQITSESTQDPTNLVFKGIVGTPPNPVYQAGIVTVGVVIAAIAALAIMTGEITFYRLGTTPGAQAAATGLGALAKGLGEAFTGPIGLGIAALLAAIAYQTFRHARRVT